MFSFEKRPLIVFTMSLRYFFLKKVGLYQECVEAYDVVLGDGSLVRASKEQYTDLYHCLPWSHGTLGKN